MRISLPSRDGSRRTSTIRLVPRAGYVLVEHLVVREGDALHHPSAAAPGVVAFLVSSGLAPDGGRVRGTVDRIGEEDVEGLVASILDAAREHPMVLVSVDNASRQPLVDPDELARRLLGMMSVHFITTVRASRHLKERLLASGFSDKFGCYNGGVRILWPALRPGDDPYDHLLLLPARIMGFSDPTRTEQVAGVFCEMALEGEDLRAWMRELDGASRPPASRRSGLPTRVTTNATGESKGTTPVAPEPQEQDAQEPAASVVSASVQPQAREEHAPPLDSCPAASSPRARATGEHWTRIAEDVKTALELAAELEDDLDRAREELAAARKALRRTEQERDELRASLNAPQSVAAALHRIERSFPERVVVLPSARASSEDSPYRNPLELLEVLSILALFGRNDRDVHDALARVFGNSASWRSKDSRETTARFGHERTWHSSHGTPRLYQKHITLGGSVNPSRCLQIYYDILEDGRIEIAWCGEHRSTVSRDT